MPTLPAEIPVPELIEYRWITGFAGKGVPAPVAADELNRIRKANDGGLLPEVVVKEAKASSSPIHPCFEWKDKTAAVEYRLWQARNLIKSIAVVYKMDEAEEPVEIRAFVHLNPASGTNGYYQDVMVAMKNPTDREAILEKALAEARSWAKRYKGYRELADICAVINGF